MDERLKEILLFANENPSCWLATTEDAQPRVRGMWMWFADETGFYFHTGTTKSLYKQFCDNPKVEAGFIRNADKPNFEMLRVTGIVEELHDAELEKRLYEERAWLLNNMEVAGVDTRLSIFRIVKGSAYIWNMSMNLKESEVPRIAF